MLENLLKENPWLKADTYNFINDLEDEIRRVADEDDGFEDLIFEIGLKQVITEMLKSVCDEHAKEDC